MTMPVPFMRATGNTTQWIDGYPSEVLIRQEIEDGHSFVCIDEQGGNFWGLFVLSRERPYLSTDLWRNMAQ